MQNDEYNVMQCTVAPYSNTPILTLKHSDIHTLTHIHSILTHTLSVTYSDKELYSHTHTHTHIPPCSHIPHSHTHTFRDSHTSTHAHTHSLTHSETDSQ